LPGVVDEDVDFAELRHHRVIGTTDVDCLEDIGADRRDLAFGLGLDPLLGFGERVGVARQDRHIAAGGSEFLRHRVRLTCLLHRTKPGRLKVELFA
jgi:hypothetical protein